MAFDLTFYSVICFFTGVLAAIIAAAAWRRRKVVGGLPLALLMTSVTIWGFGVSLEYASIGIPAKVLWAKFEYIGVVSAPVFYLLLALEYNRLDRWLTKRNIALLFVIPAITLGLAATNEWHSLIWTSFTPGPAGSNLLVYGHGVGYWIGAVGYSYLAMLVATILLIWAVVRFPMTYRSQAGAILLGALAPWIGNLIYELGLSPVPGLEVTPLVLVFTGLMFALSVFRFHLLDLVPVARATLIETMPDGMLVLDVQDRLVDINPAARRLLQTSSSIRIGQPIQELLADWPAALACLGGHSDVRVEVAREDSHQDLELNFSSMKDRRGQYAGRLVVVRDIRARKQSESALQRRDVILQAVSLAAEKFLRVEGWEQSVPEVLDQLGRAAEVSRVYIFERFFSNDGTPLTSERYEWVSQKLSSQGDDQLVRNMAYRTEGFERWDEALTHHQVIAGNVREFPEHERKFLSGQNILSIAVVPIFAGFYFWGFIGFDDCWKERSWSEAEIEALIAAADILGAALGHSHAVQALHDRQRTLSQLHDIVRAALQASDLVKMSQILVDRLGELIGADSCFLTLWDEDTHKIVPTAAYGPFRENYRSNEVKPRERTITRSVLEAGQPLAIEDVMHSPYISARIARLFPAESMLALPLTVGQSKLGAVLLSFNAHHHFTEDEIAVGKEAADLISLTLAKFQAMEKANRHAEESETLRKAGAAVAATLNSDEAVNRILEQLEQVVSFDSASVQLLRDGYLEIVGGRGWSDPAAVIGIRFPVPGENPNTIVIQSRRPFIMGDVGKTYKNFFRPPHDHIRSWLGVPLIVRDQVIGLMAIDSSEPNHFTDANASMLTAFADHVAIALENARLYSEVQDLALTDSLTGVYNRRGLFELGHIEFARTRRFGRSFSAVMVDIDHFKRINDKHGHTVGGDPILKALAAECRDSVREIDLVARYGGEEFVILLPETELDVAGDIAERLRKTISEMQVQTQVGKLSLTVSMGVATYDGNTPDLETLIARADQAMYIAKRKGRNRVAVSR